VRGYKKNEIEKALQEYSNLEKQYLDNKKYDIVLVRSETVKELKKAYPNYFIDCAKFIIEIEKIIKQDSEFTKM
jgi:hypothetical protein